MNKGIQLAPTQTKYFDNIKWLYSNKIQDRALGRTTLTLLALIDEAVNRLGERVYLRDYDVGCLGRQESYNINLLYNLLDKVLDNRVYDYKFVRSNPSYLIVDRYPLNSDLFRKDKGFIYYD